ncbi:MAG: HAMP domain-containing protein [Nevskia sp.]|nr:HAMP domain-containing protein [Nevskia sp.]
MTSLRSRLLVAASLVLAVFMLLCGAALEEAFRSSAEQVQQDKLQGLVYAILGAADSGSEEVLAVPANALPDPRLSHIGSGLQAAILDARGRVVWRSPSMTGTVPALPVPNVGTSRFTELDDRFGLAYGIRWAADNNTFHLFSGPPRPHRYTVEAFEDKGPYLAQLGVFRRTLWFGLGGSAATLIALQFLVLNWGLAPLRRLAGELRRIEVGEQAQIESRYPDELTPLTAGLNAMIRNERSQQTRYRNALDDLAHSLKTPLAVLRGAVEDPATDAAVRDRLREPLERMGEITNHQLRKAATAGRRAFADPVRLRPLAEKIAGALAKVYSGKHIAFALDIGELLRVRADEGDLYELLGNLMDNAGKWCAGRVRVGGRHEAGKLQITVEDDGPGFPEEPDKLLQRGVRADTHVPGQGLGLGAVAELVQAYEGQLRLGKSPLGGALVEVLLPV